jgi:yecA family protein
MNAEIYSYDELDEILRGDGRGGFVGISAIDGLIAAVVAGPVRPQANEWLPLIFGGSLPEASPGTVGRRAIDTILQRHDEVLAALESQPNTYRPLFMNYAGQVITRDWCIGFMLGVGTFEREAWLPLLLPEGRQILHPILACTDHGRTLLPDVEADTIEQIREVAHEHIGDAVVRLYDYNYRKHGRRQRPSGRRSS